MALNIYKSSNPDCDGGGFSGTALNPSELFPKIKAYDVRGPFPNSVISGQLYRKVFIRNDNSFQVKDCKIYIDPLPTDCYVEIALGDEADTAPPDLDNQFFRATKLEEALYMGHLPRNGYRAVWIVLHWEDHAGSPELLNFGLKVVGSNDATTFNISVDMELYFHTKPDMKESSICGLMKDIFIVFLRNFFYTFPNKDFRWSPIPEFNKLIITDKLSYNLDSPEGNPAIVVMRGTINWQDLVRDKIMQQDMSGDDTTYTDLLSGPLSFNCLAREDIDAEKLGEVVGSAINQFRDELRRMLFHDIRRITVSETYQVGGDSRPDRHMCVVQCHTTTQDTWRVTKHYKYLKSKLSLFINEMGITCGGE